MERPKLHEALPGIKIYYSGETEAYMNWAEQRIKELETFIRYDVVREFSLILEHGNWEEFESHVSNVSAEWAALQSSKDGD